MPSWGGATAVSVCTIWGSSGDMARSFRWGRRPDRYERQLELAASLPLGIQLGHEGLHVLVQPPAGLLQRDDACHRVPRIGAGQLLESSGQECLQQARLIVQDGGDRIRRANLATR